MQQFLHIFCKDVRHLWPRAMGVLFLMVVHAVFAVRSLPVMVPEAIRATTVLNLVNVLLSVGIWFLIAWLVFEEALPGDRQFWITRPYRRTQLLAAKVLFLLLFITAPMFISDCYILGAQGFPVLGVMPDLLLRQVLLTVLFVLPSFAVATVTTGVSQFCLAWFILVLAPISETTLISIVLGEGTSVDSRGGFIFVVVLAVTTSAIIIWQYGGRRTSAARLGFFGVACAYLPFVTWGIPWLTPFNPGSDARPESPGQSDVQIAYDLERPVPTQVSGRTPGSAPVPFRIPLSVTGLPSNTLLRGSAGIVLDVAGRRYPPLDGNLGGSIERIGDKYWESIDLEVSARAFLEKQTVNLRSSFDLEIVADKVKTRAAVTTRTFFVPLCGICHSFPEAPLAQLTCRGGLEASSETAVRLDSSSGPGEIIGTFTGHETPSGLSPTSDLGFLNTVTLLPASEYAFLPRHKLAQLQRTLYLHNIHLENYIVHEH